MRVVALAALSAALFASPAFASNDADGKPFTLKVESLGVPERGTIQTDLAANLDGSVATPRSAQPRVATAPVTPAPLDAAPAPAGLPQIAGTVSAPGATPTPAAAPVPVPASVAQPGGGQPAAAAAGQTGLIPGEPAKVYTTLAAAAEAGVDPLNERTLTVTKHRDAEEDEAGFDWRDLNAYLTFLKANEQLAKLGGLGVLGAILLLWLLRRRRG
ncbi:MULTISPECIES: hypothetical protein [unclassified Variovorax]|uniref:hypothetical protein n=1 Tax=unclassified Variovorax TaxID=663243 RepID=UPI00076C2713|nr:MULTISPECIES: hypothetical protein [unclassified Variovorax]KWT98422.1 hypothetical protein APY03_0557 [Variovorax sp. WDL1]PNG49909.1 hypothetical protein CHC06_05490 [Variovorax sp. B2]PNG50781.1 hypothetical protein CHC07_05395 [Variovorax sp. B4]VTV17999.1 hypothetical protein WDL1P1_00833 [Variovorax sp. WDL1]